MAHLAKLQAPEFEPAWREAWARALPLVRESPSYVNQLRVYWLVQQLDDVAAVGFGPGIHRAVCETALEVLPDPGYRQYLRESLARGALESGDIASAERWLAPCDPAPAYVTLDSHHRKTAVQLHLARGEWHGVVSLLGWRPDEVPLVAAVRHVCNPYRAHALWELGYERQAMEQFVAVESAAGQYLSALLRANEWIGLCRKIRARVDG